MVVADSIAESRQCISEDSITIKATGTVDGCFVDTVTTVETPLSTGKIYTINTIVTDAVTNPGGVPGAIATSAINAFFAIPTIVVELFTIEVDTVSTIITIFVSDPDFVVVLTVSPCAVKTAENACRQKT